MITATVTDTRGLMSSLLLSDDFDHWNLFEVEVKMDCDFKIDGSINKNFYNAQEFEELNNTDYVNWARVRKMVFEIIKGKKSPLSLKIIIAVPYELMLQLFSKNGVDQDSISNAYLNISFKAGEASVTTGYSYKTFTMNKDGEAVFDEYVRGILDNYIEND